MRVTVEYGAQLKKAAGVSREDVHLDRPCTVHDLIAHLADKHGTALRSFLLDGEGKIDRSILLFVGDHQVRYDASVDLKDRDAITILYPISGG